MIEHKIKRIEIKNLSKKFNADYVKHTNALTFFIHSLTFKKERKDIVIADNMSFDVYAGEIIGLIGKNGAGKSSLLRLIAGIYKKDSGIIKTHGKIVYLSGMGHGLSPKLTMRENIMLMGAILGLNQKSIDKKFNEIVEFSGLSNYIDMKVYQFSTGMISRLIFSVMIHCVDHQNPDILLIDEMFSAGGDADFQHKAIDKMEKLIKGGATVVLVSHDMDILKKYCNEVVWINNGEIKTRGFPDEVVETYLNSTSY